MTTTQPIAVNPSVSLPGVYLDETRLHDMGIGELSDTISELRSLKDSQPMIQEFSSIIRRQIRQLEFELHSRLGAV